MYTVSGGLEPPIARLTAECIDQLCYGTFYSHFYFFRWKIFLEPRLKNVHYDKKSKSHVYRSSISIFLDESIILPCLSSGETTTCIYHVRPCIHDPIGRVLCLRDVPFFVTILLRIFSPDALKCSVPIPFIHIMLNQLPF